MLLEDTHAYLAPTPSIPQIINLQNIYQALYNEINSIEKIQREKFENNKYKDDYRNIEHYENTKQDSVKWYQKRVDTLQNFINNYLDLLKNRYNN